MLGSRRNRDFNIYYRTKEFQKIFYQQDKNAAKKALSMWLLLAAKFDIPEFKRFIVK